VRTRFGAVALRFLEKIQSHPMGNRLKTLILLAILNCMAQKSGSSHPTAKKCQKRPIFEGFSGIPVCKRNVKSKNIRLTSFRTPAIY
jgi:hypothetical protein